MKKTTALFKYIFIVLAALFFVITVFGISSEAGTMKIGDFHFEAPEGWEVVLDEEDNTVILVTPDETAGLFVSIIESKGISLEEFAKELMAQRNGENLIKSGDAYTFQFSFEGFPSSGIVSGDETIVFAIVMGKHNDHYKMLESLNLIPPYDIKDTQSQAATMSTNDFTKLTEEINIGDIIQFGGIPWRVLDIQDGRALILSDRLVALRKYNASQANVTWENCTLRQYLNVKFYNSFSQDERSRIVETRIVNDNNPWYGTYGGDITKDKIFLLSIEEVVRYLGDSGDLKNRKGWYFEDGEYELKDGRGFAINDQYNSARVALNAKGKASFWWLRSPGNRNSNAAVVGYDGAISLTGIFVDFNYGAGSYRPALWLDLS